MLFCSFFSCLLWATLRKTCCPSCKHVSSVATSRGWPLAQTCDQHRGIVNQNVVPTDHLEWTSHTLNSKGLTVRLERQLCGMQACCLFNWLQEMGLLISSCWILWCNDTIVASKRREAWILPNMSLFVVLFPVTIIPISLAVLGLSNVVPWPMAASLVHPHSHDFDVVRPLNPYGCGASAGRWAQPSGKIYKDHIIWVLVVNNPCWLSNIAWGLCYTVLCAWL